MSGYLAVALLVLSMMAELEGSRDRMVRSSALTEPIRRRGNLSQRGRRKNIWSYNPGHRSLAFLVAGEVEMVSPPPVDSVTGAEYRCLGCCGEKTPSGGRTPSRLEPSNRVARIVLRPDGLAVIGTEPNSVNDRCLGCCDNVTPTNGVTTVTTRAAVTSGSGRAMMMMPITRRQQPWRAPRPCVPPKRCDPTWRYESSSSSEEVPAVRRPPQRTRMQPIRSRMDRRCRHLGCRSPLGSVMDDSSSSEED